MAYLQEGYPVNVTSGTEAYQLATVRHISCQLLLVSGQQCSVCSSYVRNVKSMYSYFSKQMPHTPASKMNVRHMRTPLRKKRDLLLRNTIKSQKRKIQRLKLKLDLATKKDGVDVDEDLDNDIQTAINGFQENIDKLCDDDFTKMFWNQQVYHCMMSSLV